jgi:hypothetical protein
MSAPAPSTRRVGETRGRRPFRLTEYVVPEDTLQVSCADLLWKLVMPPAEWAAYPAGHIKLTGQQKAKLYRMGLKPNWPDFMVSYNGMLGIELKTVTGRLSIERNIKVRDRRGNIRIKRVEGQREVFPRLEASGGFTRIVVCRTLEEVEAELRAFGVPLRGSVA